FERKGADSFTLAVRSKPVRFLLRRDETRTELVLPEHKRRFLAKGALDEKAESLAPLGFMRRLLGANEAAPALARIWVMARLAAAKRATDGSLPIDDTIRIASVNGDLRVRSSAPIEGIHELRLSHEQVRPPAFEGETIEVSRKEMERMIFRAVRRAIEIYTPVLAPPPLPARKVAHGELRFVKGQRLVLLEGSPEEIGKAHGELLGPLIRRTLNSYVYLVGAVETVRTGKWFLDEMEQAWKRLSPHIPVRHRREMEALAAAVPGMSLREIRLANVLPEYFHCSGFAVFGKATTDGVLYHGRILDYMTAIGLQHAAGLFFVRPADGHDFVHVGYAGFVGAVTGMNRAGISLGEMGGKGRYRWDGVPMASLMRQALEECDSLDEVKDLWRRSPRTCEYYYVFADAKGPRAVGVKATPDLLEFLEPGQDHEQLGKGIEDVVFMSGGSRLEHLRTRIQEGHGKIDQAAALRLMDRPVAMKSNLHSALMLPQSLEILVAHAGDGKPAAERPYVRFDFATLSAEADRDGIGSAPLHARRVRETRNTKAARDEASRRMLDSMLWDPRPFRLKIEGTPGSTKGDALLRFPSPLPLGEAENDEVVVEWHRPLGAKRTERRPALLCLHILGGNMELSRGIARMAKAKGMHAFLLHMPGYGKRKGKRGRRDMTLFEHRSRQAAADVQRAQDCIASLEGIDPGRIYLQGTSLGGIIGALSAGLADDFAGQFFMLAGGGLKQMLREGKRDSRRVLEAFHRAGIRGAELDRILDGVDPARLAHRLDSGKTWLYSAKADTVVPPSRARLLASKASLPDGHHLWVEGNHYTAIVSLPWVLDHMFQQIETR
ncbi:MAG: C45 family autoproteolytic acyltransferase/hydrolase, partial [Planctomycetota bacterium]